ncbi:MAG: SAM-dependent methyltransferase [Anaerolineae bacterium]|nr:MAG: SAM-dependent methyltransferase [Anaerolineae bacterium]
MNILLLDSPHWKDYELLDTGAGWKLERFGPYRLVRPEAQAMWKRGRPEETWRDVHAVFRPTGEESGGHWELKHKLPEKWTLEYNGLRFSVTPTPGRHLGVFPETAAHWDWYMEQIRAARRPIKVLNLFGYTGIATLAAAKAGAAVTHVDASKKSVIWARENQDLSGLTQRPIRWIVDDALKFVQREARRGVKYDAIILDPPKFGRGPKGEVWEVYESLPHLLQACYAVLSQHPLFFSLTMYAVRASAIHLHQTLDDMLKSFGGVTQAGELVTREQSQGRLLSHAVYARWSHL